MNEQATVVYADILGFSNLVMSLSGAIGMLDGFYYSSMSLAQLRESFAQEPIPDPLTRTFAAFHRTLIFASPNSSIATPCSPSYFLIPPSSFSAT